MMDPDRLPRKGDRSNRHRLVAMKGLLNGNSATVDIPDISGATETMGGTMTVAEALACPEETPLDAQQRRELLDQLILALDKTYVHLALKRTKHATDPIAALQRMRRRVDEYGPLEFHLEIMRTFKSLRDQHTAYILPKPYSQMIAFLPFLLGACYDEESSRGTKETLPGQAVEDEDSDKEERAPCVVLTSLLEGFDHPHFRPGVEILSWNGIPIDLAVRRVGRSEQASNTASEFALGVRLMTVRWLGGSLPPEEYVITVSYLEKPRGKGKPQKVREIRFAWNVVKEPDQAAGAPLQGMWNMKKYYETGAEPQTSRDERSLIEKVARQHLFKSRDLIRPRSRKILRTPVEVVEEGRHVLRAWKVSVRDGGKRNEFGMIRIVSFEWWPQDFRDAFIELLAKMPDTGLVIDIRSNPGGYIRAAEMILQTLTDTEITPMPFQFLANTVIEELVKPNKLYSKKKVEGWFDRVEPSVDIGSMFSLFGPMSAPEELKDIGRKYHGPVVLLTNAVTYSSGDIFAASFKDHKIGIVMGVDANTGGGGANMWPLNALVKHSKPENRFKQLPGGANMHVAVRRCTRLGDHYGLPIEEAGVSPDRRHFPTKRDLLEHDADLLVRVSRVLKAQKMFMPEG